MNLRDVAFLVVHDYPGGAGSLAPRMNTPLSTKSATTLQHEVNGTGTAKLGLETAELITHFAKDLRILAAWALKEGQMLVPLPESLLASGDDCLVRMGDTAREFGELCTEVSKDLGDGKISDNELARIDRECGELMASLHALRESLAKRNAANKGRAD